jgi:uncharacterized glyoxalase superfamily protein PhnB
MRVTSTAISLNVADVAASAEFAIRHFGFRQAMGAGGFASLERADVGFDLVFLRAGMASFKPATHAGPVTGGLLVVLVVDDVEAEHRRMIFERAPIVTPIQTESWGERFFQVRDPNGVVYQLVQWVGRPG